MKASIRIRGLLPALLTTVLAAATVAPGMAAAVAATNADSAVTQRVRAELRVVMAELVESGAFGDQAQHPLALTVDTPSQQVNNLGLLVDSAGSPHADGVHVLAVTPGSNAERAGVRAGDRLLALNGTPVGSGADLRQMVDTLPNGSALAFRIERDGQPQALSGTLSSTHIPATRLIIGDAAHVAATADTSAVPAAANDPAAQGCGRISDLDVAPRQQHLHGATIISIDGNLPGPQGTHSYRVAPGPHVLQVSERIENRYLTFNDRLRNSSDRYKTLTVDVQPGVTTLIAARLNPDKSNVWQNGAYWDPVAWKQIDESCR